MMPMLIHSLAISLNSMVSISYGGVPGCLNVISNDVIRLLHCHCPSPIVYLTAPLLQSGTHHRTLEGPSPDGLHLVDALWKLSLVLHVCIYSQQSVFAMVYVPPVMVTFFALAVVVSHIFWAPILMPSWVMFMFIPEESLSIVAVCPMHVTSTISKCKWTILILVLLMYAF